MFASPFFTSGRSSILPDHRQQGRTAHRQFADADHGVDHAHHRHVSGRRQRHAVRLPVGVRRQFAFVPDLRALHLAAAPARTAVSAPKRRRSPKPRWCGPGTSTRRVCATCAPIPLIFGIALIGVGWATGGGAAQILFSIFGEIVFNRGPEGIGDHLGMRRHRPADRRRASPTGSGQRLSFNGYKRTIVICYVIHGGSYIVFSQMRNFVLGAGLHRALARRRGGKLGAERDPDCCATSPTNFAAACLRPWNRWSGRP